MKILNLDGFIKEGYTEIVKTVTDILTLKRIRVKCTWDGEHWYYYDKENKGSFDDFKKLGKNRNANFDAEFRYDFTVRGEGSRSDDTPRDEFTVEELVRVHFNDMAENDYDIDFEYCHNANKLADIVYEYDADGDNDPRLKIRELISDDLNDTENELASEIEDRTGIKDNYDIIASVIGEAISGVMDKIE